MVNVGRICCVALPFILTVASLICLLIVGLAGVTNKDLYLFEVNTTDLSISASSITKLLGERDLDPRSPQDFSSAGQSAKDAASSLSDAAGETFNDASSLLASATAAADSASSTAQALSSVASALSGTNITASDLGLADSYYVSLWSYCQTSSSGDTTCTKAQFDWASNSTKSFENKVNAVASTSGQNITLPDSITGAMSTFSTVTKWTEVVFIIACIALGVELLFGVFANCSRAFSCITFLVALVGAVAVCAAAALSTVLASVVIGAVEASAKVYGVRGSINTSFLAAIWLGAAFAIGAAFFWMATICCCKPDHRSSRGKGGFGGFGRSKHHDDEAGAVPMAGGYTPLQDNNQNRFSAGYGQGYSQGPSYGNPRRDPNTAYEPYKARY